MFDESKKIGQSPSEMALHQEKHRSRALENEIHKLNGTIQELRREIAQLKSQLRISPRDLNFKRDQK